MTRRKIMFLGGVLLQIVVIGLLVAREEWNLGYGSRIELEVVGRDPLDPFAGAYQYITLAIERLPRALARGDAPLEVGERVFVALRSGENGFEASGYSAGEPSPESDLYLRGRIVDVDDQTVGIDYGLSRYYVPFGAGDPTVGDRLALRLVVFVTADGRGTIEDLLVEGVPFDEWNRGR